MKVFTRTVCFLFVLLPFFVFANTPPKVDAGPIKRVIFPASNSTTLVGKGSDADGPVTFKWTLKNGDSKAKIAQPTSATTDVSNLKPGLYTFLLTVTDNAGVSKSDTTTVTVLQKITWTVAGAEREALVHFGSGGPGPYPIMFAFHGHGGTDSGFAERAFELFWPEAIVVYPQGLRTSSPVDSNCKQSGWQLTVGEVNCRSGVVNQDLKFFDAMLKRFVKKYNADSNNVFAHGWSNGGDFVYDVLWSARVKKLAGISPAGASLDTIKGKKPLPVIHVAGTQDVHVLFEDQQQSTMYVRTLDKCAATGNVWATGAGGLLGTEYPSAINMPVVFLQYEGTHNYPFSVPPLIVKFFKEVTATSAAARTPLITHVSPMKKLQPKRLPAGFVAASQPELYK